MYACLWITNHTPAQLSVVCPQPSSWVSRLKQPWSRLTNASSVSADAAVFRRMSRVAVTQPPDCLTWMNETLHGHSVVLCARCCPASSISHRLVFHCNPDRNFRHKTKPALEKRGKRRSERNMTRSLPRFTFAI